MEVVIGRLRKQNIVVTQINGAHGWWVFLAAVAKQLAFGKHTVP